MEAKNFSIFPLTHERGVAVGRIGGMLLRGTKTQRVGVPSEAVHQPPTEAIPSPKRITTRYSPPPPRPPGPCEGCSTHPATTGHVPQAMLRLFNFLIETSDEKTPASSLLGTNEQPLRANGAGDGEIPRNMRLALTVVEMVQPYLHLTSPRGAVAPASDSALRSVNCTHDGASGDCVEGCVWHASPVRVLEHERLRYISCMCVCVCWQAHASLRLDGELAAP